MEKNSIIVSCARRLSERQQENKKLRVSVLEQFIVLAALRLCECQALGALPWSALVLLQVTPSPSSQEATKTKLMTRG